MNYIDVYFLNTTIIVVVVVVVVVVAVVVVVVVVVVGRRWMSGLVDANGMLRDISQSIFLQRDWSFIHHLTDFGVAKVIDEMLHEMAVFLIRIAQEGGERVVVFTDRPSSLFVLMKLSDDDCVKIREDELLEFPEKHGE